MNRVVLGSQVFVFFLYATIAVFGYLSWAGTPMEDVIEKESNLLEVDY